MDILLENVKNFVKSIIIILDNRLKTDFCRKATQLRDTWYSSDFFNMIRRKINFNFIFLMYKIRGPRLHEDTPLKLHLGCGNQHLNDYVNIDMRKTRATDLVCDIRKLPYPEGSVTIIEIYHVIEHLPRHNFPEALKRWYKALVAGGRLIIECPDFDEDAKQYVQGNKKRIDNIFGLQRFPGDTHLFGYNYETLKKVLQEAGFVNIQRTAPQDYHSKDEPCLRVESVKAD